jgi:hypothetical protein
MKLPRPPARKSRRAAVPESEVLRDVLHYLKNVRGWLTWRNQSTPAPLANGKGYRRFTGLRGIADMMSLLPDQRPDPTTGAPPLHGAGRLLCVEAKSSTGKLREQQRVFLTDAGKRGALCLVVRSVSQLIDALRLDGYA